MEETEMEAERNASGIPYHPEVISWYSDTLKELGVVDHFADADLKGWSGEITGGN